MSSGSKELRIDEIEQYDATESLLYILKRLDIKQASSVHKDLRSDLRSDFYCGECDMPHGDCDGHPDYDDYPDYYADYDEDRDDASSDKPVEGEKV